MAIDINSPCAIATAWLLAVGASGVLLAAEPTPLRDLPAVSSTQKVAVISAGPAAPAIGGWTSADSSFCAAELARKILADPGLDRFILAQKQHPKLRSGKIVVRAEGEVVNSSLIIDKVQRQLLASGKIDIVETVDVATRMTDGPPARPAGNDVFLSGSIVLESSDEGAAREKLYTITLKGTDFATSQLLFSVEVQVRKEIASAGPRAAAKD